MKRNKGILLLALGFVVSLIISTTALASERAASNVTLEGNADGIVFIPGKEPFLQNENMLPGDKIERTMKINNKNDKAYTLYMRAERVTKKEEHDLLNNISLKIKYNDRIIYEGPASGENDRLGNIYLGSVNCGEKYELEAEAILEGDKSDNNYKNKNGVVTWVFTAVMDGDKAQTEIPTDTSANKTTKAISNIKNNITRNFKTGDPSAIVFVVILGSCIGTIFYLQKKNYLHKKEDGYEK